MSRRAARCRSRRRARHREAHGRRPARPPSRCAPATGHLLSRWLIAWVGDCRIYRVRTAHDEPAELLTRDDTYGHLGEDPPPGGSPDDPARMVGNGAVAAPNVASVELARRRDAGALQRRLAQACRAAGDPSAAARARAARALLRAAASSSRAFAAAATTRRCSSIHRNRPTGARSTMTPEQIDRVFGRGRLKMVTGEHVEVFREAVVPGERRRYTKRFLNSTDGDFAHWTEREWRILARLIGHGIGCVPDVVQFDRGSAKGAQLVQTYDAGVTVDQWATLLPLCRDGHVYRHAFEDCAHWWALAHSLPRRAEGDPSAAARASRHQGRQRLHSRSARRASIRTRRGAALSAVRPARADRLRVFAGLAARASPSRCRSAGNGNTTISRRACCRRSTRVTTATCGRRASSTGAATSTVSPRC